MFPTPLTRGTANDNHRWNIPTLLLKVQEFHKLFAQLPEQLPQDVDPGSAILSHARIRCADEAAYSQLCEGVRLFRRFERVVETTHKGRGICWVKLRNPLAGWGLPPLHWLEITGPDEHGITCVDALVYKLDGLPQPISFPMDGQEGDPRFTWRFQPHSAEDIIAPLPASPSS